MDISYSFYFWMDWITNKLESFFMRAVDGLNSVVKLAAGTFSFETDTLQV